ncbi:MAG: dihydroneopterin aldolase [Prevotella sp.]|nr:dihydroneopterin aldolase [Prevotella sp.]
MESYICLDNVRLKAFHGVMPQEQRVGGDYLVSLRVGYPIGPAMESDAVGDTLDYSKLLQLVKQEMAIPSQLLEHVAGRMVKAIAKTFPLTTSVWLRVVKLNPPMGADSDGAAVELLMGEEDLRQIGE